MLRETRQSEKDKLSHLYVESNKQNKLTNKIETDSDTDYGLIAVRSRVVERWAKKVKGLKKTDKNNSMVMVRGKGGLGDRRG